MNNSRYVTLSKIAFTNLKASILLLYLLASAPFAAAEKWVVTINGNSGEEYLVTVDKFGQIDWTKPPEEKNLQLFLERYLRASTYYIYTQHHTGPPVTHNNTPINLLTPSSSESSTSCASFESSLSRESPLSTESSSSTSRTGSDEQNLQHTPRRNLFDQFNAASSPQVVPSGLSPTNPISTSGYDGDISTNTETSEITFGQAGTDTSSTESPAVANAPPSAPNAPSLTACEATLSMEIAAGRHQARIFTTDNHFFQLNFRHRQHCNEVICPEPPASYASQ